jgi:Flp pilus assembly pilin Flp
MNVTTLRHTLRDLMTDESGQDAIEYALLAALVGIASLLIWQQVAAVIGTAYAQADSDVQGLACMPGPDGTGCP